jgi:hypothetical protein
MEAIDHLPLLLRRAFEGWENEEEEEVEEEEEGWEAGQRAKYLMADASISTTPPPSTPMDPAERERQIDRGRRGEEEGKGGGVRIQRCIVQYSTVQCSVV